MELSEHVTYTLIIAAAFIAWIVSTVAGGGGGLLLLPVMALLGEAKAAPPALALGTMLSSPARVWMFWRDIDWTIVRWYLPGAIVGGFLGAWLFTNLDAEWVKVVVGIFLVSTIVQYRFGERAASFPMRAWRFLPVALVVSFISGTVGEAGPVLNPFFLNYGADKERMIGTKAVNSLVMQLVKSGTYALFGAMPWRTVMLGIAIGVAATLGSYLGKRLLARMHSRSFRQLVIGVMVASGLLILWQERDVLGLG